MTGQPRVCAACQLGEHGFCEGREDVVIAGMGVPAVPLNCSCLHGPSSARHRCRSNGPGTSLDQSQVSDS